MLAACAASQRTPMSPKHINVLEESQEGVYTPPWAAILLACGLCRRRHNRK